MEQKFEKSFIEKFGDFYSKKSKRALFSLGCILLGVLIEFILPGIGAGAIISVISVYNVMSICEKENTRYINTIHVTLPNGNVTPCALFEQRVYAHAPMIMAFFSIGFYVPYKIQYILVRNMEIKTIAPSTRVSPSFLTRGLLNIEIIPKSKYLAVIDNPQIVSDELYAQIKPRREAFLRETKPFIETGVMEEVYHTDNLSVCKLYDETFMLFHYQSRSGDQCGVFLNEDFIEKIKEDDGFLLEAYLQTDDLCCVFLTNKSLERLLRNRKSKIKDNTGDPEINDNSEMTADSKAEIEKNYLDEINKNKKIFTRETIASRLKAGKCTWRLVLGIILLYFSLGSFSLTAVAIGSGMIILTVIGLPAWILFTYLGVKNIKISNKNRNAFRYGQYKIMKVTCTKRIDEQRTDADGDPCGYSYTYHFSNGDALRLGYIFAVKGDTVYLVYLEDGKKIDTFFNAIEYMPADDFVIEE